MPAPHPDEVRMSLGDHLEELRSRLFKGLIGPIIFGALLLVFGEEVLDILVRPLRLSLKASNLPDVIYNLTPGETFNTYIKISLIGGLILGIPWLLWHLWKFIEPGLHFHERKFVTRLIPGSALLTVLGVLFMYFILLPLTLYFLIGFSQGFELKPIEPTWLEQKIFTMPAPPVAGDPLTTPGPIKLPVLAIDPEKPVEGDAWVNKSLNELRVVFGGKVHTVQLGVPSMMQPIFTLAEYVDMVLWMGVAFAVAFQLPLVMLIVGWTGIISYEMLSGARRYALLVCVIVAAILTPSGDPVSLAVMTAPLYGLYEVGLLLIRFWSRRQRAQAAETENESSDD